MQEHLKDSVCNLSTDEAVQVAKHFLRNMAQPFSRVSMPMLHVHVFFRPFSVGTESDVRIKSIRTLKE